MLQRTLNFLLENKTFFIATIDGEQPRVRPFGLVVEHDGQGVGVESNLTGGGRFVSVLSQEPLRDPSVVRSPARPPAAWPQFVFYA